MRNRKSPRAYLLPLFAATAFASALLVSPPSSGQDRRRVREDLGRSLRDFDELSFDPPALLARARKEGRLSLRTSRGSFDLDLEPFDVRADNYRAVAVGPEGLATELGRSPARWFRGAVTGLKNSRARFVLDESHFEGVIVTPEETYYVEPAGDFSKSAAAGEFVFYAASSVKASADDGVCGTTLAERVGAESARQGVTQSQSSSKGTDAAFAPEPQTDVATEADFEYTQTFGGDASATNNDIQNIIAMADGIYDAQLGVKLRVVFQRAWTANNDPYTLTAATAALAELRASYEANPPVGPNERDIVHMFTGKDMDGSIIGIAYTGVACNAPDRAYGISQSKWDGGLTQRVALTAHEIGHNFGASHTGPSSNASDPPQIPGCDLPGAAIMQPSISATTGFCQFSRDQITNHVSADGSCLTRLVQPGCAYAISPASQFFTADGGTGMVNVTTGGGCVWGLAEGSEWIDANGPSANGPGAGLYTVRANTSNGPRQSSVDIAGQTLTVRQAASPACQATLVPVGVIWSGSLDANDCRSGQPERPGAFIDLYTFVGRAGRQVKIEMNAAVKASDTPSGQTAPAEALDAFLYLFGPDGSVVASNDDVSANPHNTDARIPVSGVITLPQTGLYTIEATSFDNSDAGSYTLTLDGNTLVGSVDFETTALSVSESTGAGELGTDGSGFRVVNVTRTGDTSGTAVVDYETSDRTAEQRKDYEQARGALVFNPGEATKSFTVFVVNDTLAEGPETVNLHIVSEGGVALGLDDTATLTINSDDSASAQSPVRAESFDTVFFVRQQYLDFLGREPDASGFAFWKNEIDSCGQDAQCREVKRINVSAAFFLSIEFQNTGFLVERMYKVAYGDVTLPNGAGKAPVIRRDEFLFDTQRIGQGLIVGQGDWQQQLEANKRAYALDFVLTWRFLDEYPPSMTPAQFVDKLSQRSGVIFTEGERDQLVSQLSSSADIAAARAAVLRQVADDTRLQQQERNRAFVLMQYYGYLRRNPNDAPEPGLNYAGWLFWLNKLNDADGNFVSAEMVKAFLTSDEYVNRFGL